MPLLVQNKYSKRINLYVLLKFEVFSGEKLVLLEVLFCSVDCLLGFIGRLQKGFLRFGLLVG